MSNVISGDPHHTHAVELAQLVDLEARWENLREKPLQSDLPDLHGKQKAYEAFHGKLVAYNKRYTTAHQPELLLNTAARLGKWCRTMRDLCRLLEHDSQVRCPSHLVEKAYRWADRIARRVEKQGRPREALTTTMQAAIKDLDDLGNWCDELAGGDRPE